MFSLQEYSEGTECSTPTSTKLLLIFITDNESY